MNAEKTKHLKYRVRSGMAALINSYDKILPASLISWENIHAVCVLPYQGHAGSQEHFPFCGSESKNIVLTLDNCVLGETYLPMLFPNGVFSPLLTDINMHDCFFHCQLRFQRNSRISTFRPLM